ncbi:MAG TPA: hypothetical protein VF913_18510 [Xanthobacteraceae bacterium]
MKRLPATAVVFAIMTGAGLAQQSRSITCEGPLFDTGIGGKSFSFMVNDNPTTAVYGAICLFDWEGAGHSPFRGTGCHEGGGCRIVGKWHKKLKNILGPIYVIDSYNTPDDRR